MKQIHFLILILLAALTACEQPSQPEINLDSYHIRDGYELSVIASEPLIEAPVAIDFDDQGRLWTVEMKGYMSSLDGENEEMPNGVISILEDTDGDGRMDKAKVFLDSLILPRAIRHVYGGLLYATPPNLWFVEYENDQPIRTTLVDSMYAVGGNVEHQPNGLLLNIDNWVYNAKSNFRYRKQGDKWLKEPTTFRGQWGITSDKWGRLFYNNNSTLLIGDHVLPNTTINNEYHSPVTTVNKTLSKSQRVRPIIPTLVNRGYMEGVLDSTGKLINATSTCGPVIYKDQKMTELENGALICVPEANLVNWMTHEEDFPLSFSATNEESEFLVSSDEAFRPVNLNMGMDGNMYVVDMHRGVIQHKAYMTTYLRDLLLQNSYDTLVGMGRILKISPKKDMSKPVNLQSSTTKDLITLLSHTNGEVRLKAQHKLLSLAETETIKSLINLTSDEKQNPETRLHALYVLEGTNSLKSELLFKLAIDSHAMIQAHALKLLGRFASEENLESYKNLISELVIRDNLSTDVYVAATSSAWIKYAEKFLASILSQIAARADQDRGLRADAIASNFHLMENLNEIVSSENVRKRANKWEQNISEDRKNNIFVRTSAGEDFRTEGLIKYKTMCAQCHGIDGKGINNLAPPLVDSEYVSGSSERLIAILLHGMKGPITVNQVDYNLNATMPGLKDNQSISDKDIVQIITFIRNGFASSPNKTSASMVDSLRSVVPKDGVFTSDELNGLFD